MTVNASARKVQLLIGEKDFSDCFIEAALSDNHLDQSGLVACSGTITLGGYSDESLDDRKNTTRFFRGQSVVISVGDKAGVLRVHPRGRLRILSTMYNLGADHTPRQALEVGCLISLLNYKEPIDSSEDIEIELGGNTSAAQLIIKFLQKADISKFSGILPDARMNYAVNFTGSYLSNVGKLLYANNLFAWIDNTETFCIESADVTAAAPNSMTVRIGHDEIWYKRIEGAELPCNIIKAVGRLSIVKPTIFQNDTVEEFGSAITVGSQYSEGQIIVIRRTTTRQRWDKNRCILVTDTRIEEPIGLFMPEKLIGSTPRLQLLVSERRIQREIFEKNQEGKLLKTEVEIYRPNGLALAEFLEAKPNVIASIYTLVLMEESNTTYTYDYKNRLERIKLLKYQLDGLILAGTDEDWNRWIFGPTNLVRSETRQDKWEDLNPGVWTYEYSSYKPLVQVRPERVVVESGNSKDIRGPKSNKLNLVYGSGERKTSNSGQYAPPAPERSPAEFQMEEIDIEERVQFDIPTSNFRPRERTFSVEFLAGENRPFTVEVVIDEDRPVSQRERRIISPEAGAAARSQLQAIARREGNLLIGRSKGQELATDFRDEWFGYSPLMLVTVIERDGSTVSFRSDGGNWIINNSRCLAATDCILVGFLQTNQEGILGQVTPLYPEINTVKGGIAFGVAFNGFPWSFNKIESYSLSAGTAVACQWNGAVVNTDWDTITEETWDTMTEETWDSLLGS